MAQNFLLSSSAGRNKMAELALIVIMMSSLFEIGGCTTADLRTSDLFKGNGSKLVQEISTSLASKFGLSHKNDSSVPNVFEVVNDVSNLTFDEIVTNLYKAVNHSYFDVINVENIEIFRIAYTIFESALASLFGNYILAVYSYAVEHATSNMKLLFAEFGFCVNNNITNIAAFRTCNSYLKDMVRVNQP